MCLFCTDQISCCNVTVSATVTVTALHFSRDGLLFPAGGDDYHILRHKVLIGYMII